MPNNKTNIKNVYAISDIHGCYKELLQLLRKLTITPETLIIFMGDYVDRGPQSKEVIDLIISLIEQCCVVTLKGNHEDMMYEALVNNSDRDVRMWMTNGGYQTLLSYGDIETVLADIRELPEVLKHHLNFIKTLELYYETDTHIFVHASPSLNTPINEQPEEYLIWRRPQSVDKEFNYIHLSSKTIVSGHTAQSNGVPRFLSDKNILIDTGCFFTGVLTAFDVNRNVFIINH